MDVHTTASMDVRPTLDRADAADDPNPAPDKIVTDTLPVEAELEETADEAAGRLMENADVKEARFTPTTAAGEESADMTSVAAAVPRPALLFAATAVADNHNVESSALAPIRERTVLLPAAPAPTIAPPKPKLLLLLPITVTDTDPVVAVLLTT